jgi:metallo-beta-lactamase family protein
VEKQPLLKIFGEEIPLRAQVEVINGYSAHADRNELTAWINNVKLRSPELGPVWLVHGEAAVQDEYQTVLSSKGYSVHSPEPHTRVSF